MRTHDIVVIGASAGGVEALIDVIGRLPPDLPAAIFAVLHISPESPSVLPSILARFGRLAVGQAFDGVPIQTGRIYVAPPDRHMLIDRGHVRVVRGPRENGSRPAADPLFRTAARAYGPRVIGVVLSGTLDDGTAGLQAIKRRGGLAIVQDPETALFAGMPRSALENVAVDACLPLGQIGPRLNELVREPVPAGGGGPVPEDMDIEAKLAEFDLPTLQSDRRAGTPSGFGCPDCGGALWEIREDELIRFRCRIGHAYSAESLLAGQSAAVEEALSAALRALEERVSLARRLSDRSRERGIPRAADRFDQQVSENEQHAAVIRRLLLDGGRLSLDPNGGRSDGAPAPDLP